VSVSWECVPATYSGLSSFLLTLTPTLKVRVSVSWECHPATHSGLSSLLTLTPTLEVRSECELGVCSSSPRLSPEEPEINVCAIAQLVVSDLHCFF